MVTDTSTGRLAYRAWKQRVIEGPQKFNSTAFSSETNRNGNPLGQSIE